MAEVEWTVTGTFAFWCFMLVLALVVAIWILWVARGIERGEAPLDSRNDFHKILRKMRDYRYPSSEGWTAELTKPINDIMYNEIVTYADELRGHADEHFGKNKE